MRNFGIFWGPNFLKLWDGKNSKKISNGSMKHIFWELDCLSRQMCPTKENDSLPFDVKIRAIIWANSRRNEVVNEARISWHTGSSTWLNPWRWWVSVLLFSVPEKSIGTINTPFIPPTFKGQKWAWEGEFIPLVSKFGPLSWKCPNNLNHHGKGTVYITNHVGVGVQIWPHIVIYFLIQ